jgi:predicted CXXCH cytochrome family protein
MVRIMTTSITRAGVLLLFGGNLLLQSAAYADGSPHWSNTGCQACHAEAAPVDGANLQAADAESLCESCHGSRGAAKACRHGSEIPVREMKIDATLSPALKDGQVVCSTCHDVVYQCKRARVEYSFQNPGFLRDRTSRHTGEYCSKCHSEPALTRLNPHKGVTGNSPKATCPLCHVNIPESDGAGELRVSFNMQHDLNDACLGCHNVRPHPRKLFTYSKQEEDRWVHLVSPAADVLEKMQQAASTTGVALPLNPQNGEIYCATCHDPHEFKGGPVAEQPKHRLRADDICQVCHDK